jgi:FkbM family methyltransferase
MTAFDKNDPTYFFAHHIGGRNGSITFPHLPKFSADIAHVIYDADESCLAQIEEKNKGRSVKVLPYCLADKCGTAKFHINYCPFTSSLYPINTNFGNFYHKDGKYDYVFEFACKTEKIIDVETKTLDSLVEAGIVSPPDFLSIDTQGAELPILMGASQCLINNTVAVFVEINFDTLYEGAPLFGKLDEFLRSKNFLLAEITPMNIGYKRIPELFRGKGIPIQGEALYLLHPNAVKFSDEIELSRKLDKLAFAACAFGYTELAYEALERSASITTTAPKKRLYQLFLTKLFEEMGKKTQLPPLWHEIYSFEESNNRFKAKEKTISSKVLKSIKDNPIAFPQKVAKWALYKVKSTLNKFFSKLPIQILVRPKWTAFESFLINNGFHIAALGIRERKQSGS